jgi:hypothetical protein
MLGSDTCCLVTGLLCLRPKEAALGLFGILFHPSILLATNGISDLGMNTNRETCKLGYASHSRRACAGLHHPTAPIGGIHIER